MISIAMATYNGAKYIREQLNSILNQTIQDFELVVCDDCSTDRTWDILEAYAKEDSRIRVYLNDVNLGFKKNFEKALSLTTGEYIALCDQDDIWTENHLELLLSNIGDRMVSAGNSGLVDEKGVSIGMTLQQMEAFDHYPKDDLSRALSFLLFRNPVQGAAMLIKRDFLYKALPIPDGVKYHDAWFSVFCCFYVGMAYTETIVNNYRMHCNNVTGHRVKRKSRIRHLLRSIRHDLSYDRAAMIQAIEERIENLSIEQKKVLKRCSKVISRNKTLFGRLLNSVYRVLHFRTIYSC